MISTDFIYGHRFRDIGSRHGYRYVKTDYLDQHLAIKEEQIIICHNSCCAVSDRPMAKGNQQITDIPDGTLIYTTNMDIWHSRVHPLPLGLENPGWHPENMEILRREMAKDIRKGGMLYMNYGPRTEERIQLSEALGSQIWVTRRHGTDYATYLREMNAHRFVLCPEGHGFDTHRTWETLYLGSIPVVKRRVFTEELSKVLPMVVLDDLRLLTLDILEEKWEALQNANRDALAFSWWAARV
jgi:hypothetical protein